MPPSGFSRKAVNGALVFVRSCYEDLLADVRSGKFSTYEEAIEYEIAQIDKALRGIYVSVDGHLLERGDI